MTEERQALIRYRLERARETFAEAELLARSGHWNGCVNRLYYSCFYAVATLLLRHGLASSKHSGVRSLFNRRFVKTGLVEAEVAIQPPQNEPEPEAENPDRPASSPLQEPSAPISQARETPEVEDAEAPKAPANGASSDEVLRRAL